MANGELYWKLADHPKLPKGKTVAVVVLDGWGENICDQYNAIHVANTPTMDSLRKSAPERWRLIRAHGPAVGLPTEDDMGNSEVGHNALGAGRIYAQGRGPEVGSLSGWTATRFLGLLDWEGLLIYLLCVGTTREIEANLSLLGSGEGDLNRSGTLLLDLLLSFFGLWLQHDLALEGLG
eukprot:Gb_01536 [translate_table: standard]